MNLSANFSREFPTDIWPHPLMARLLPSRPANRSQRSRGFLAEVAESTYLGPKPAPRDDRGNTGPPDELRIRQLVAGQIDGWHDTATAGIERFQTRFLAKFGVTTKPPRSATALALAAR